MTNPGAHPSLMKTTNDNLPTTTRERIITAADRLFYEQGFDSTSFATIAAAVDISRGNFYYHFKSKDDILAAVIEHRLARTQALLVRWQEESDSALQRIGCFINILIINRGQIKQFGCPAGTLCSELAKLDHALLSESSRLLQLFRNWLASQFIMLGRVQDADALAIHVLARSQGIATLASAFQDEAVIYQEIDMLKRWLQEQSTGEQTTTA